MPTDALLARLRIWRSLSPFLARIAGNAHRAELNIEKLFNPWLPEGGKPGLLEFRGLRLAPSPERLVGIARIELCLRPLPGRPDRDFDPWNSAGEGATCHCAAPSASSRKPLRPAIRAGPLRRFTP